MTITPNTLEAVSAIAGSLGTLILLLNHSDKGRIVSIIFYVVSNLSLLLEVYMDGTSSTGLIGIFTTICILVGNLQGLPELIASSVGCSSSRASRKRSRLLRNRQQRRQSYNRR